MKNRAGIILLSFLITGYTLHAQPQQEADKTIQKGNDLYKQQQYDKADAAYQEVLSKDQNNSTANFNHANALIKQSKADDAMKTLDNVVMNTSDNELKGKAYYNKGVILTSQKKLEESIEAYKNALRQNSSDKEARENLQKALLELKKKTPPPPPKPKKQPQQKKQQQQPKMDQKEAEQRLKLMEQKEKEVQQRLQDAKSKNAGGQPKDW